MQSVSNKVLHHLLKPVFAAVNPFKSNYSCCVVRKVNIRYLTKLRLDNCQRMI